MGEYRDEAVEDAKAIAREFLAEIIGNVMAEEGETREIEVTDYSEDHIQTLTDSSYKLQEAVKLLLELGNYEETDSGLWAGQDDPREALKIMAAMTYGNAVTSIFNDLMESINNDIDLAIGNEIFFDFDDWLENKGKVIRKGPFEWRPGVTEKEREGQEEALHKEHMDETLDRVEKVIKNAIKAFD